MKVIKLIKYEKNRKIFAPKGEVAEKGTYVNHREIADFIRQGYGIKVYTHKTGTDVTNDVLRKILVDDNVSLSTESLFGIIRG